MNTTLSPSDINRFWIKVNIKDPDDCWKWNAYIGSGGYGRFQLNGFSIEAHRLSWIISKGNIPEKKLVLHKCDNKSCVNPNHLYLGSYSDNNRDIVTRNPNSPESISHGMKLYAGEIWLIRRLNIPTGNGSVFKIRKFSALFVSKMFKVSESTIQDIWKSDKHLCRERYYM